MIKLTRFPNIELDKYKLKEQLGYSSGQNTIMYPNKHLINYYSLKKLSMRNGRLSELIFFGLNYNAKRLKHFRKPWVLDLQKSHKIKVDEDRISEVKTKVFKRRVLFFSYNREKLNQMLKLLKKSRKQNSYSGHGLIERNDSYKTKPGKVRQK